MSRTSPLTKLSLALTALALPALLPAQTFTTQKISIGGDGFFDYLSVDPGTNRVFVSRGTHVMVVDGTTGKLVGDIANTPRVHGAALVPSENHGFTTNGGDSTLTMFDLGNLAVIKKIPAGIDGLDGFMWDDETNTVLSINHSHPTGTAVVVNARTGDVVGRVALGGNGPEGGVSDGKGRIFINLEDKNSIDVVDTKTWKVVANWPIAPCDGPTGIAMDRTTNRIFAACSDTSVVIDATTGKVVAKVANGDGVDALGWDQAHKLMYIPAGQSGNVTVVHEDSPDKYTVVATVPTMRGARTLTVDPQTHVAYVFTPEFGPAPAPAPGSPPPAPGRRGPRGPIIASWLIAIKH
ncbi:MAG: YncE family protein [Gemmatimonadaceae bacterium]